jgi:predicted Zn-dependent peptidase
MKPFQTHTLKSGLRIIHHVFPSQISYCGFAVNTGARDEMSDEHGMAHFVEHLLFKGTKKRKAHHIANRMENVGGELNAYTTKEETFLYATFLEEYFPRAVELLSDLMLNSEFSPTQIERERDVILDEINSYNDSPAELIYDDFENLLFAGHDIGHYILGDAKSLKTLDSQKVINFVTRQFHPSQMVFFSFGKTPFEKVVRQVERYFSFPATPCHVKSRIVPTNIPPEMKIFRKNTAQNHTMLGCRTFDMYNPLRYPLYLLNNILGGGALNSRLNTSLRERHGLVYNVESSLTFYSDTGLFSVYFACDPKYTERCLRLIYKEIERLRNQPLTAMQLSVAKKQWKGQMGIASESNENTALRMAKSFLHSNNYPSIKDVFSRIDAISISQLEEAAHLFLLDSFSKIEYF